jgi:hypothetical protein
MPSEHVQPAQPVPPQRPESVQKSDIGGSVLLVSGDSLLAMSLEILARGQLLVTRIDPSHRP